MKNLVMFAHLLQIQGKELFQCILSKAFMTQKVVILIIKRMIENVIIIVIVN